MSSSTKPSRAELLSEVAKLLEHGLEPHLLEPRRKFPGRRGWSKDPKRTYDQFEVAVEDGDNLGVRTGTWCEPSPGKALIVVDMDVRTNETRHELEALGVVKRLLGDDLDRYPMVKTGSAFGSRQFHVQTDRDRLPKNRKVAHSKEKVTVKTKDGPKEKWAWEVEVMSTGKQVVCPPSVHPDTSNTYRWIVPLNGSIPDLPDNAYSLLAETRASKPPSVPTSGRGPDQGGSGGEQARIRAALEHVDQHARENWLTVGAALHDWNPTEVGYEIWTAWSERSTKFDADDQRRTWEGFRPGRANGARITLGSLYHLALEGGWNGELDDGRPVIQISTVDVYVPLAEQHLAQRSDRVYQRGGELCRVVEIPVKDIRGLESDGHQLAIQPWTDKSLVEELTRAIRWEKFDGRMKRFKTVDAPDKAAKILLERRYWPSLPVLTGTIESPTLLTDGTLLDVPGYHTQSGLLYRPALDYPALPPEPNEREAEQALARIENIYEEFPFQTDADRSVALAGVLTFVIRRTLPNAPLFAIDAPIQGSGKSLLANTISLIGTERAAPSGAWPHSEEEMEKRLYAQLRAGVPMVVFDNTTEIVQSDSLCAVLTEREYNSRTLGKSETRTFPTSVLFVVTGNNLSFDNDMSVRTLTCRIDPKAEHPEERVFKLNLWEYIPAHRGQLVVDCLTVLKAYDVAGYPNKGDLTPFGRFEDWDRRVRGALVWLGRADPCAGRGNLVKTSPELEQIGAVLKAWHDVYGENPRTAREVVNYVGDFNDTRNDPARSTLHFALMEVAPGAHREVDATKLGRWISKYEDRRVNGLRFERVGAHTNQGVPRRVRTG